MCNSRIEVTELDIQPLESFSLKWRWTDGRYNELPDVVVSKLQPLTRQKAAEVWEIHSQTAERTIRLESSDEIQINSGNYKQIQEWLENRIGSLKDPVFVSWTRELAVKTTSEVFCNYWDDFCYPSSDDLTLTAVSVECLLLYSHEERFSFRKVR